ncbi:hypothetical protein L3X38_009023 [Prunus dulcis]|uniref:Uncharacterized protein n=1 Tax=Prunus dulcis TaxID=3755 RepID=A0AAD4ZXY0_PRUDU|nr:hypothetical protein L3X38_009023 [Prunus dulcis]
MGREIVYENANGRPEEFSRLWKHEDVTNVLNDESGTKKIEGVALHGFYGTGFSAQAFTNMKKLRLLHLRGVKELTGEYKDFPKKLIWLCWHHFPLESIPDDFPTQPKLVALDLQWSALKIVWKDCKLHQNLKILNLSNSHELTKSPDFSKLPNLEELILQHCMSLSEVHSSIGDLGRLSLVNLEGCLWLEDLPLNFYKSKSIETLLLNGCCSFEKLAEGLGDMVSLTTLKADETCIRQIPSSISKLKKLEVLSLSCDENELPLTNLRPPSLQSLSSLRELALVRWGDALPKDLNSIISLERLDLAHNDFCSLPSLSRLSQLQDLSLHMCKNLRAIPDLPTNLKVLKAGGCIALEKMPDFSEMSNIRELHLSGSDKLTEVPGLDKSLNSMTMISMDGCTNLTADFRKNILQGWTSCGYGGIFLSGNDIPDWFDYVHDDDIVYFTVPRSVGRNLKGLTLSFVCSSSDSDHFISFSIKNMTKGAELEARIILDCPIEGYYLWQGQLSNDELKLQDGDTVLIEIIPEHDYIMVEYLEIKVKKAGVSLVWDKFMNENMIDYHLCRYERRPSQNLVNDDDIIHVENDNHLRKSPDFSKFPNLEKLILKGCEHLYKIHSSIGHLERLSLVNLEDCEMLRDLPLNFYKSKSIETLILNGCSRFEDLADGLGDMVSLTILEADYTAIRQIPSLAALSKLKVLSLNACRELLAIPDLPTNLDVLKANGCPKLETISDFSKMSNMRELYLCHSFKLTEVPGLDKSLNSMTMISMDGCTNLTADFRKNILQGWTSCGYGGIFLSGNDIPDWFDYVHDDDIVYFTVPRSVGRNLKGLTLSFVCSSSVFSHRISFSIKNMTKGAELEARIILDCPIEGYYLWQGQLSNDELKLQDGDKVLIEIIPEHDYIMVEYLEMKKAGVSLVWDKFMNENMIDYHLCRYERRPSQNLVNDDDIIHVENDNHLIKSPDFSKFPNLEKLILKGCKELIKVHSFIGDLGRLSLVNLEDCEMLRDLPLNFYKSKSIETLILNGCWRFEDLADGLGDMVSLTILEADYTAIRQIPSLAALSKLKVLSLNACRELLAIPDLPTNLDVLKAIGCPKLETTSDFSKMSNMRELYLCHSFKLTEVPGLDKSLNSMTRIHMEGCTNLTTDFRNSILQRWTSCGFGGIYLDGIYDIPEWFKIVNDVDNIVFFEVPQRIMGRYLKGLTICFIFSYFDFGPKNSIGIIIRNDTKQITLHAKIAFARYGRPAPNSFLSNEPEDLWQGQLSNDVLRMQGGDQVSILVRPLVDFGRVKKTGVHLEWDKVMKENMYNLDPHLYDLETNRDFSVGVDDAFVPNQTSCYTDFFGGTGNEAGQSHDARPDDGAGRTHDAFVVTNQSSAVDEQLTVEGCFAHLKSFLFNLFFNCFSHPR